MFNNVVQESLLDISTQSNKLPKKLIPKNATAYCC